ncbi:hypothetical protein ACFFQF_18520 [Haladaptatus pallidirubidus]
MDHFRRSFQRTGTFIFQHSISLVIISICWFVGSLPLVTSGPATLGAYSAIHSIRNGDRIETRMIRRTLRRHGLNATLLGFVPIIVGIITAIYFHQYIVTNSTFYIVFAIGGVYLFAFLLLISLTTFVRLSDGCTFVEAVKDSYGWVIHNPLLSMMIMLTSGVLLLIGIISIVGLVVIIPAILFSFHLEVVQTNVSQIAQNGDP